MYLKNKSGFTIVELLIVIVVIGILAAITIVAYNGIQERARLASAQAFASQLHKKHLLNAEAIYTFNECSGNSVSTQAGRSINATVHGVLGWSTATPSGTGCAADFDGNARIATTASLSADYYLKAAWVNVDFCANNNVISSPDVGGTDAPLYLPDCRVLAGHSGSYGRISSPGKITPGKWHHIAVEFDDGKMRMWIDGQLVNETTGQPAVTPIEPGINIGAHRTGSRFSGLMDDVIIVSKEIN